MKKLFILAVFAVAILSSFHNNFISCYAKEEDVFFWAKVENDDSFFYAQPSQSTPLFTLPKSYFVKLVGQDGNFYKAQYQDLIGYVKTDSVKAMDGTPKNPYFSETFRAFLPSGTGLYATTQSTESEKLAVVPYLFEDLIYYGSIHGQEVIPEKGNLWHYCKFGQQQGFVYSIFCDKLSSPPLNTEEFNLIASPSFEAKKTVSSLSPTAMAFIIIGVSLPCLVVLYLLVKPNMMRTEPAKQRKSFKSKKRRDYFEFDPSDLN